MDPYVVIDIIMAALKDVADQQDAFADGLSFDPKRAYVHKAIADAFKGVAQQISDEQWRIA